MGKCFSCFKVTLPAPEVNQTAASDHKDDKMEFHTLFSQNSQGISLAGIESHFNGNRKSYVTMTTFNGGASDKCNALTKVSNSSHSNQGIGSRVPPPGKGGTYLGLSASTDYKSSKEVSDMKINSLFDQYKDQHEDIILADGIERLCEDLQLSPDDFQVLILAWKLSAEQMCQFNRIEFLSGLKNMKVDSIRGIQLKLPEIVQELEKNGDLFKDLYRFTFRFGLDVNSGERILPADMAIVLWKLVFTIREPPLLGRWLKFLECYHVRGIPRDTWNMFLNFAESIGNDLTAYDDTEAWPSLFDDFVEYENDQMNQNIKKDDYIKDT